MLFKHQKENNYEQIETITNILESENIDEADKSEIISDLLQELGMLEYEEAQKFWVNDFKIQIGDYLQPVDVFQFPILDGVVEFQINAN